MKDGWPGKDMVFGEKGKGGYAQSDVTMDYVVVVSAIIISASFQSSKNLEEYPFARVKLLML